MFLENFLFPLLVGFILLILSVILGINKYKSYTKNKLGDNIININNLNIYYGDSQKSPTRIASTESTDTSISSEKKENHPRK